MRMRAGNMNEHLDDRDAAILAERLAALAAVEPIHVGDFLRHADGTVRRVSYVWPDTAQTSDGGSYYLGKGYLSMSGSLYTGVSLDTITPTDETRQGHAWFFHHDWHTAGGGVDVVIPCRLFETTELPRRS